MPDIILRKDIAPNKGWVKGKIMTWPRPTISAMEKQQGGKDWYEFSSDMVQLVRERKKRSTVSTQWKPFVEA